VLFTPGRWLLSLRYERARARARGVCARRAFCSSARYCRRQSFASQPTNILECHFVRELVKEKARKRKMKGGKTAAFHTRCTQPGRQATKHQPDTRHTQNSLRFATFTSSFLLRALFISGVRTRIMPGRRIQFSSRAPTSFIYCGGTLKGAFAPPCVCVAAATHDPADRRRQTLYFLMQIFCSTREIGWFFFKYSEICDRSFFQK
jgi:hypothetical protein